MIGRQLEPNIRRELRDGSKVVVLLGPRQVGKTTVLKELEAGMEGRGEVLNGETTWTIATSSSPSDAPCANSPRASTTSSWTKPRTSSTSGPR